MTPSGPAARRRWGLGHKARDAAIGRGAQVACARVFVFVPLNERQEVSVVTAQAAGREEPPLPAPPVGLNKTSVAGKSRCATLAGGGGGRPAQPQRGFPEAAPPHAGTTRGPPRPAASGLGRLGLEGDAWIRHPKGARRKGGARAHKRRGPRCGTRDGCGPLRGRRAQGGLEEGPAGLPNAGAAGGAVPPAPRHPALPTPAPGWGRPLTLVPYLPRGLRSPLFGRPQP